MPTTPLKLFTSVFRYFVKTAKQVQRFPMKYALHFAGSDSCNTSTADFLPDEQIQFRPDVNAR
jgi:hypothetical protein